jgi:hypothetical protein
MFTYFVDNNVEHFFICLFSMYISSSVKCLFISFVYFLVEFFTSLLLSCENSLCTIHTSPLLSLICKSFLIIYILLFSSSTQVVEFDEFYIINFYCKILCKLLIIPFFLGELSLASLKSRSVSNKYFLFFDL